MLVRIFNPRLMDPRGVMMLLSTLALVAFANEAATQSAFAKRVEADYHALHDRTEDKLGLESILEIHQQLDDDKDGTIEPSETGDFIRDDLHETSDKNRQKLFHKKDSEITVTDLWHTWRKSEVHNWTTDSTIDWLVKNVELPQYSDVFRRYGVNGAVLPQVAVNSAYLAKVLGITNPIHRQKISVKAMDVVLFGPPKDQSNFMKDLVLSTLLTIAVVGLLYAYKQNKKSQEHLKKMMTDMDSLSKAEKTLQEMQEKLHMRESQIESMSSTPSDTNPVDAMEVSRLKEEVEVLRNELHRAEVELEDRHWMAPQVLQHWLQLTFEMESQTYNNKKKSAEEQLAMAKDMCEKLKRKRSSLVGAFVSTHGRSIDDVDRSILEARTALMEVTKDLQERTQRWRQIEMLCGCAIMSNPGIAELQTRVRHVGVGNRHFGGVRHGSRMSNSHDDLLDDIDAHSVAASSTHMSISSHLSRPSTLGGGAGPSINIIRNRSNVTMSRESSKESSSSDEQDRPPSSIHSPKLSVGSTASSVGPPVTAVIPYTTGPVVPFTAGPASVVSLGSMRASTPPAVVSSAAKRDKFKQKSQSHDAGTDTLPVGGTMTSSVSDGQLGRIAINRSSNNLERPPTLDEEHSGLSAASDSGSQADLSQDKKKKKKSAKILSLLRGKKDKTVL